MTEHTFDDALQAAPRIRLFLGVTTLNDADRAVRVAVYAPSRIDRIYMEYPHNPETGTGLKPCGKTILKPDMNFTGADGQTCNGVVLVPEDKTDAILNGCSMQNGRLSPFRQAQQRCEYEKGQTALKLAAS